MTAPEGLRGMIQATALEIEQLKKRQMALLAVKSRRDREDGEIDGDVTMDTGEVSGVGAGVAVGSGPGKKRKAAHDPLGRFTSTSTSTEELARLHKIEAELDSYTSQLKAIESNLSTWSASLASTIDTRLAEFSSTRDERLKQLKTREDEQEELIERLEKLIVLDREKVDSALKEADGLENEVVRMEERRGELVGRVDKVCSSHSLDSPIDSR